MKRYLVAGVIAAVLVVGGLVFVYRLAAGRALADVRQNDATRARMIVQSIDQILRNRMAETFTLAALPSLRGLATSDTENRTARVAVAAAELQAIAAADTVVRAASVADINGKVVLTTDEAMGADWGERPFMREALAGHLYASVPGRDFGEVSQFYSSPILDNGGNVAGVLVVRVDAQELWMAIGTNPDVYVLDENGVRIVDTSRSPKPYTAIAVLPPSVAASLVAEKRYGSEVIQLPGENLAALAAGFKQQGTRAIDYAGADGRTVYAALDRSVVNPWTVVVFSGEEGIGSMAWEAVRWAVIAAGTAFMAGAVCMFVFAGPAERAP